MHSVRVAADASLCAAARNVTMIRSSSPSHNPGSVSLRGVAVPGQPTHQSGRIAANVRYGSIADATTTHQASPLGYQKRTFASAFEAPRRVATRPGHQRMHSHRWSSSSS